MIERDETERKQKGEKDRKKELIHYNFFPVNRQVDIQTEREEREKIESMIEGGRGERPKET